MLDEDVSTVSVAAGQLKSIIERVERLEEEKAGIAANIREIFAEAKGNGFDTKVMRQISVCIDIMLANIFTFGHRL